METSEKLEYEFFRGKRSMSILLFIKKEKQLYKIKSRAKDKVYYVCYEKDCYARVHLSLSDNSVYQPKNSCEHNHMHDQENVYKQLKPFSDSGGEDAGGSIPVEGVLKTKKIPLATQWSTNDENALIDIWEDKFFDLTQYEGNSGVYEEISMIMKNRGLNFTAKDINIKLNKIFKRYKIEKNKSKKAPSKWKFFSRLDAVFNIDGNLPDQEESSDSLEFKEGVDPLHTPSTTPSLYNFITKIETNDSSLMEATPIATKRKFSENSTQEQILKKIDSANARLESQMNDIREISRTMLELQKETLKQENRRNFILENMAMESLKFKKELLKLITNK